jgi:hypothetical protein
VCIAYLWSDIVDRDLWTPEQTAKALAVPEATLKRWRYVGIGPAYSRLGRHVRYDPADVAAYLAAQRVTTRTA